MSNLVPGVLYILSEDVTNPTPDRRSNDWYKQVVIPKGKRVYVTNEGYIAPFMGYSHMCVSVHTKPELFKALMEKMVEVPNTLGGDLLRVHILPDSAQSSALDVLCAFIEQGVLTKDQVVEMFVERYNDEDGDTLLRKHGL